MPPILQRVLDWVRTHPKVVGGGVLWALFSWLSAELSKTIFFDWLKSLLFDFFGRWLGIIDVTWLTYLIVHFVLPGAFAIMVVRWMARRMSSPITVPNALDASRPIPAPSVSAEQRQQNLNEIAQLREQLSELRIAMERPDAVNTPREKWEDNYLGLQHEIAKRIAAVAGTAEATVYVTHGNVELRQGGPPHQIYIDMCVRDLDYLLKFIHDYSRREQRRNGTHEASLPLSITKIDAPSYSKYSGLPTKVRFTNQAGESKEAEVDPPNLGIREVFISNTSLTRSVTLKISLVILDKDGRSHKLTGEGRNSWGMVLGHNDRATRTFQKLGAPPPSYIVSPVTIAPQQTVRGALTFIINMFSGDGGADDEQVISYYAKGSSSTKKEQLFRYTLEIEDVVSGVTIAIPLPSDGYKGHG